MTQSAPASKEWRRRGELQRAVWTRRPEFGRTINELVGRVRQKIEDEAAAPRWITLVGRAEHRFVS